jgi:hypothetical protein
MDLSTQSFVSSRLFDKAIRLLASLPDITGVCRSYLFKVWFSADQTVLVENGFHLFGDGRG